MRHIYWLIPVVVLGLVIRLFWLDKYPTGFTPDEAAFGYNAYSLLKTGHDEWGLPFWHLFTGNLESFGDFKLPLYAFLTVPAVKFLGLTQSSTRLPNAILGSLAVPVLYCLSRTRKFPRSASLFAALLLALSSWHISLSRGAFEANLITLFSPCLWPFSTAVIIHCQLLFWLLISILTTPPVFYR